MFTNMCVTELCDAIKEAFYKGFNDHAQTLLWELQERLDNRSI